MRLTKDEFLKYCTKYRKLGNQVEAVSMALGAVQWVGSDLIDTFICFLVDMLDIPDDGYHDDVFDEVFNSLNDDNADLNELWDYLKEKLRFEVKDDE